MNIKTHPNIGRMLKHLRLLHEQHRIGCGQVFTSNNFKCEISVQGFLSPRLVRPLIFLHAWVSFPLRSFTNTHRWKCSSGQQYLWINILCSLAAIRWQGRVFFLGELESQSTRYIQLKSRSSSDGFWTSDTERRGGACVLKGSRGMR